MKLYLEPKRPKVREIYRRAALLCEASEPIDTALVLRSYLGVAPLHFDARQLLRRIEIEWREEHKMTLLDHPVAALKIPMLMVKARQALADNPVDALTFIEDALELDVFHEDANKLLAEIGAKLDNPRIETLAYETLVRAFPKEPRWYVELAHAYMADANYSDAVDVYEELLELSPDYPKAQAALNRARELNNVGVNKEFTIDDKDDYGENNEPRNTFDISDEISRGQPVAKPPELPIERGLFRNAIEDADKAVSFLAETLETIESAAQGKPARLRQWREWVVPASQDEVEKLERALAEDAADAATQFELGVLRVQRLELPEARECFSACASHEPEVKPTCYALMALCLFHESILHRPADGPSLEDFAWFV